MQDAWRSLIFTDDVELARVVSVTIASMGFTVRWRLPDGIHPPLTAPDEPVAGAIDVEVRSRDWADLDDVLEELLAEQAEFDAVCQARQRRLRHRFIIAMAVLIGSLVAVGALDLSK